MGHPLDNPRLENTRIKLERADKHLSELRRKVDAFAARDSYAFDRYIDAQAGPIYL